MSGDSLTCAIKTEGVSKHCHSDGFTGWSYGETVTRDDTVPAGSRANSVQINQGCVFIADALFIWV